MPLKQRAVTVNGIVVDNISYFRDVLRPWINTKEKDGHRRRFVVRRDPRDISVVHFFDPELKQYFAIPYRDTVGAGIKDALRAIHTDRQLGNRFETVVLPRWTLDREFRMLLMSFEQSLPLRNPSNLAGKELATVLLSMSEGTIGELANLLCVAAAAAIKNGREQIDVALLKQVEWTRPSERKAAVERLAS